MRGLEVDQHLRQSSLQDEGEESPPAPQRGRSRRELPAHAVAVLKAWLVAPEHFHHPYPTAQDQAQLMAETGIDKKQLKNWFTNARRRIWKPLVKHKLESGDTTIDPSILDGGSGTNAAAPQKQPPPPPRHSQHLVNGGGSHAPQQRRVHTSQRPRGDWRGNDSDEEPRRRGSSFLDLLATAVDEPGKQKFAPQFAPRQKRDEVDAVRVSAITTCAFCARSRVDTQLMPCKHLFHGHCLRPWLEATVTTPCCPVCAVAISNCVLADSSEPDDVVRAAFSDHHPVSSAAYPPFYNTTALSL